MANEVIQAATIFVFLLYIFAKMRLGFIEVVHMVDSKEILAIAPNGDNLIINSAPHASPGNGEADHAGTFFMPLKPPRTFPEQLERLRSKGLAIGPDDEAAIIRCLSDCNYYRLRGYWLTLERNDTFLPGTSFWDIWDIAQLDAEILQWIMGVVTPIEVKWPKCLDTNSHSLRGCWHRCRFHVDYAACANGS